MHTFFGAESEVRETVTASDASLKGGVVRIAHELTPEGKDFVNPVSVGVRPRKIPVLVLSLFNGIGGALRCYDILGLIPTGILCFDVHGPANRATAKRWSQAEILGDVRLITREMVQSWFRRFVPVSELHIWAGFPCTDLPAAKSRRLGLEGTASSLFWEVKRVGESRSSSTCHGQIYS